MCFVRLVGSNHCAVCIDGDAVEHFRCLYVARTRHGAGSMCGDAHECVRDDRDCFDFDLCGSCYSKRRLRHKGGKHLFSQVLA